MARGAIVVVAGLAAWLAVEVPDAIPAIDGARFSLAASALLPALLLGIVVEARDRRGGLAGMIAGLAVCLYYMLAPRYFPFAFYETSSVLSKAHAGPGGALCRAQAGFYLADETAQQAALAAWDATAREARQLGRHQTATSPAIFAVPVGFSAMIGVSLFTPAAGA